MKKLALVLFALSLPAFAQPVRNHALATHHTIKATARPFKVVGKAVAAASVFSFEVFDAAVIDPFGVALQVFADGVDMGIAAPLEALPRPLNEIGVGIHYVYEGVDWTGQQLAK